MRRNLSVAKPGPCQLILQGFKRRVWLTGRGIGRNQLVECIPASEPNRIVPSSKGSALKLFRTSRHGPGKGSFRNGQWKRTGLIVTLLIFFSLILPQKVKAVSSETLSQVSEKLDRWDVEEAWTEVKGLLIDKPKDPNLLEIASKVAFHRGDYPESLKLMKSALSWKRRKAERILSFFSKRRSGSPGLLKNMRAPISRSVSMRNRTASLPITSSILWKRPTVSWLTITGSTRR